MGCQHLEELYELYLLGALDPEDTERVSEHVRRQCPSCCQGLREAALTVYLLCQTTSPARASARVDSQQKADLLRRLRVK
ncbi:MAG: hypothetical protein ACLQOO_32285 [Terriglobia bacterium]